MGAAYRSTDPPPYAIKLLPLDGVRNVLFTGPTGTIAQTTEHPEEAWQLMQFLNSWEFFENYNTAYYPAQKSLLERKPFPAEMTGFSEQFARARSWGPYATGPATIASMWNQTSRSFGQAFIGEKSYMEAAEELLGFVRQQLPS